MLNNLAFGVILKSFVIPVLITQFLQTKTTGHGERIEEKGTHRVVLLQHQVNLFDFLFWLKC